MAKKLKREVEKFVLQDKDLRWIGGCQYDYHRESHCEDHGCDDEGICRCSTLEDVRLTSVPDLLKLFPDNQFDVWSRYCVGRLLSIYKTWDKDNYEIEVGGDYYGEEIRSVTLNNAAEIDRKIKHLFSLKANEEKVDYVLTEEYGFVLDSLKGKTYKIKTVTKDSIRFGQTDYYKRLDKDVVKSYEFHDLPRGIVLPDGDHYRVIDGYHRLSAGTESFEVIVAVPK